MYACNEITFESYDLESLFLIWGMQIQVKFVYEGHRVRVKVTQYYHTSILSTRVAYPVKKQDLQ